MFVEMGNECTNCTVEAIGVPRTTTTTKTVASNARYWYTISLLIVISSTIDTTHDTVAQLPHFYKMPLGKEKTFRVD